MIQGLGLRVLDLGFSFEGLGALDVGFPVEGLGFWGLSPEP